MKSLRFILLLCVVSVIVANALAAQWIKTTGPKTELTLSLAVGVNSSRDTILYAGTGSGGVFVSTDYGDNWTEIDGRLLGDTIFTCKEILSLATIPNKTGGISLFAGTNGDGVFFSLSADTNWVPVNSGLTGKHIYALVANPDGKGEMNLYAGTDSGIFLSTNEGANWVLTTTELMGYHAFVIGFSAAGDTIFFKLANEGGVLRSTDKGNSWIESNNGLPTDAYERPIAHCLAANDTIIYAGANWGYGIYYGGTVYFSLDGGKKWVDGGGMNLQTAIVRLVRGGPYLFAGVSSPGINLESVWRRPLAEMTTSVERDDKQTPSKFTLFQNYPNPFNSNTTIRFELSVSGFTTLKVLDVLGREIATLKNEMMRAGEHSVQWNASSLSSGVYVYWLQIGNHSAQKKLVLMK